MDRGGEVGEKWCTCDKSILVEKHFPCQRKLSRGWCGWLRLHRFGRLDRKEPRGPSGLCGNRIVSLKGFCLLPINEIQPTVHDFFRYCAQCTEKGNRAIGKRKSGIFERF